MDNYQALANFFGAIWNVLRTPMELPYIGNTSPLAIMLFLSLLGMLADFAAAMIGGKNSG